MSIAGFNPPIMCIATGCDKEAVVALDRENLESGAVTHDLYLCDEHAQEVDGPGTGITTVR
jgi:hypothetical protein